MLTLRRTVDVGPWIYHSAGLRDTADQKTPSSRSPVGTTFFVSTAITADTQLC